MIIISARKFRDSQNEILKKALSEEVILTTLHFGNFRLVPIVENKTEESEAEPVKKKTRTSGSKGKAIVHQQPPISGTALESMVDAGNLAAAGSQAAAAKGTTSAKKSAVRDENNILFPDLFASIETEPNPDRDAISGSASENPDRKIKARSRKSDPSRRRGKALPSSFGASRSDTDTPVMSNIPQWASGSDAASVSRKPEAPALAELVVDPQLLFPAPMAIPPPKPTMPLLPLLPIRKPPLPPKHITPTLMPRVSKAGRETIPTASMTTAIRAWCQQASTRATHARTR